MPLLGDAVLMGMARLDASGGDPVVVEHPQPPLVEAAAASLLQLVSGRRQVVRAALLRAAAQRPERPLQPADERLEALAEDHGHPGPAAEGQPECEEEVDVGDAGDRHPQRLALGEVHLGLLARSMLLLEEDLLFRTVHRSPVTEAALERPHLSLVELARTSLDQVLEHGLRLEVALGVRRQ